MAAGLQGHDARGGDHTAQALQGLTFGGSSEGIGIGLGMGMLQQAHTHGGHPAHAAYQFKQVCGRHAL